jgi:purine-nucleoside phosphorylase
MSTSSAPQSDSDEFAHAQQAAEFILSRTALRPRIALVLGSGLGSFADELENPSRIPYTDIPAFPRSTAVGHAGQLVIGTVDGVSVAAMQGRVHLYEGYSAQQVGFPIRVFGRMGIKAVVVTNAAGGINPNFGRGAMVVIRDHINLQGQNPLTGPNEERFGPRFPDMTDAYNLQFRKFTLEAGTSLGGDIYGGVYAALAGPSYETPAEIRYLRSIGADLVGMSTVPEVIVARHMNIDVLAISCVTNMAAGMSDEKINHDEVLETGERLRGKFLELLRAVLPKIDRYLDLLQT